MADFPPYHQTEAKSPAEFSDFQVQITPSKRKTVSKVFVNISGNFSVINIRQIQDEVMPAVESYEQLTVKLSDIRQIDLAAVQFLNVLSRTGKAFKIDHELSASQKQQLTMAGFSDLINH